MLQNMTNSENLSIYLSILFILFVLYTDRYKDRHISVYIYIIYIYIYVYICIYIYIYIHTHPYVYINDKHRSNTYLDIYI